MQVHTPGRVYVMASNLRHLALGKRTVPVLAVAEEVAALQRAGRGRDLGELRTDG